MSYIRDKREIIHNIDDVLLLHPSLIEEELVKVEKRCPIYLAKINGVTQNVLIASDKNMEFAGKADRRNIKYDIPQNVLILVGGLEGKYYIKPNGIYYDEFITKDLGYKVIERNSGNVLLEGSKLNYLGRNIVQIDDFFINKNNIMYHNGTVIVFGKTGYFMEKIAIKNPGYYDHHYVMYDSDGIIAGYVNYSMCDDYDNLIEMALEAPKLPDIDLPKNSSLYEKMIIDMLKDTIKYKYEFSDCQANTLIEMTQYLREKQLDLAVDIDSLEIFEVDYKKYFNQKNNECSQDESKLVKKLTKPKHIDNK